MMNHISNFDLASAAALHLEKGERDLSHASSMPTHSFGSVLRESAGDALISLGKRIKPAASKAALKPQWQGR
jgi:hypothetical protein